MKPLYLLINTEKADPILTTAKIEGPEIRNDAIQYKFVSIIGTKG